MENGMGGNVGVGGNSFPAGSQNPEAIEPAQADAGAIMSTDETSNADYAADFENRLNQQSQGQTRKGILKVVAIVFGVLAVIAIVFLLIKTQNFGANSARRQSIAQTQNEVDILINLISTGKYNADNVKDVEEGDELYMQKIIDASKHNKEKEKTAFFKNYRKSLKNIEDQLKEKGGDMGMSDIKYQKDAISELSTAADVFEAYANIDYSDPSNFVAEFEQNGKAGIEDKLIGDSFSMTRLAREKLVGSEENESFVFQIEDGGYKNMVGYISSEDEFLTFIYYMNLDYIDKLNVMLTLYQQNECIQEGELDEVCRLSINNTEEGIQANKNLISTTEYIKDTMNDWCEGVYRSINNLKTDLEKAGEQ